MLSWSMTPDALDADEHLGPKRAPDFPEVRNLLQTVIAGVSWPRSVVAAFSAFSLHAKLTQSLVTDVAVAQY